MAVSSNTTGDFNCTCGGAPRNNVTGTTEPARLGSIAIVARTTLKQRSPSGLMEWRICARRGKPGPDRVNCSFSHRHKRKLCDSSLGASRAIGAAVWADFFLRTGHRQPGGGSGPCRLVVDLPVCGCKVTVREFRRVQFLRPKRARQPQRLASTQKYRISGRFLRLTFGKERVKTR